MTLSALQRSFAGKRVLVTGSTGFKGSWLCEWLLRLGAEVHGFALAPEGRDALFSRLGLGERMKQVLGDVRDPAAVLAAVRSARPDFVFHLAAQPLVRLSYERPVETYAVNVMGTVHLLEALRLEARPCACVLVTTDKCYDNREWLHSYREEDPMGGHDPYSSSKGMAELAIAAYRRSFFHKDAPVRVASARAGNVIGAGDWAADRIVPDCIRSLAAGTPIAVRNRNATRPWQHVLEPLAGYLSLAAGLADPSLARLPNRVAEGFNFGPDTDANRTVRELVEEILRHWPGSWDDRSDPNAPHEATLLHLSIDKARHVLGWHPVWSFPETIAQTVDGYRALLGASSCDAVRAVIGAQIETYTNDGLRAAHPHG